MHMEQLVNSFERWVVKGGGGGGAGTVQYTHFDTFYANGLDHGTF